MNKTASFLKIVVAAATFAFAANGVGAATVDRMPVSGQMDQTNGAAGAVVSVAAASYYVVP